MEGKKRIMVNAVKSYAFSSDAAALILGPNDRNLSYLEGLMCTDLIVKGTSVAASPAPLYFTSFMERLEKAALERGSLSESEILMEFQLMMQPEAIVYSDDGPVSISVADKLIRAKSQSQRELIRALGRSEVVFASGPAGTGKTFLSVLWALSEVLKGHKKKLILTRPVVEAGETLGFLPGDLQQKLGPYLRPLYDAMEYALNAKQIARLEENGALEIAPLAYMRGRSVNNAIMILDEAQNATASQIRMFLTRLGEDSQAIVTGDPGQSDLPSGSGLEYSASLLYGIKGVSVIRFSQADIVRSRIVRDIVAAYAKGRADDARSERTI